MLHLKPVRAVFTAPRTYPLTPLMAKRLTGLLGACDGVPVVWQGGKLQQVEVKRHPYDEWTKVELAGNIDTTNHALRYRAVVHLAHGTPAMHKDLVTS